MPSTSRGSNQQGTTSACCGPVVSHRWEPQDVYGFSYMSRGEFCLYHMMLLQGELSFKQVIKPEKNLHNCVKRQGYFPLVAMMTSPGIMRLEMERTNQHALLRSHDLKFDTTKHYHTCDVRNTIHTA